jgi:DNA-binding transcriptional regulator YdaS (Cro superfamily)
MQKSKAIELLGGNTTAAAKAIGISYQAVNQWPDILPPRIADRVAAALARSKTGGSHANAVASLAQGRGVPGWIR